MRRRSISLLLAVLVAVRVQIDLTIDLKSGPAHTQWCESEILFQYVADCIEQSQALNGGATLMCS